MGMVYIVVLNWKGATDTIACLKTLFGLVGVDFRIIICDNASPDDSYGQIRDWLIEEKNRDADYMQGRSLVELDKISAESHLVSENEDAVFLVQTGNNLGYAGGNNVGIRLALNQEDMQYVWILNNDTEVEPNSLSELVKRCQMDSGIGICGSRLVYYHDRNKLQGLGGLYNPWLCTTRHYAAFADSTKVFDDDQVASEIDYVIGASMLLTRPLLEQVGLLCEDYFLYYEELDICLRAKGKFRLGVASNSVVYHKEGASTGGGRSDLADYYAVRNRLLLTKKLNHHYYFPVLLSLVFVCINRIRRLELKKAAGVIKATLV